MHFCDFCSCVIENPLQFVPEIRGRLPPLVWIFGERDASGGTQLGTVQVGSDGSWSLTFKPTRFTSTHTNIYVYAHSKATGQTTEIVRGFNIKG